MTSAARQLTLAASLLLAALLGGCDVETFDEEASRFSGNAPPPAGDPPDPDPDPPPTGFGPSFSEIQANVFTPDCATSGCHDAGAAAGLDLRAGMSYAVLVDIPSSQDGNILRVRPGNPDASYLVQKLEGTAATGQQMPPGGALPQAEIDVIRQWIVDGALDDSTAALTAPIQVSSLSPAPNATLDAAPTQVVAGFTRELDAGSVNATTFVLEASGGDNDFTNGNETAIQAADIRVPAGNPQSAIFDLTGVDLADDDYRIRLLGEGASVIMDIDANALDGEFSGVFPSGNGTSGGDFVAVFTLATPVVVGRTLDEIEAAVFTLSSGR